MFQQAIVAVVAAIGVLFHHQFVDIFSASGIGSVLGDTAHTVGQSVAGLHP